MKTKEEEQQENDLYAEFLLEDCKINPQEEMDYPPIALSYGSHTYRTIKGEVEYPTPIATYGNFSFIQAPPKTKKTFFISLLASVYLSDQNHFGGNLKGHRQGKELIHIDTEQGRWHCQRVFKRIAEMAGTSDDYLTYGLRTIGYKDRIEFIDYCLEHKAKNAGLLIVDGIADLCADVNNIEESNACVQRLMEWSSKYNIHIMCVIHSNFGSDKPTGHLGSFLEKKAELQIQLEANTVNKEWITVKCKRSRGYAFDTFSFKVNEMELPEIIGDLYDPLEN